MQISTPTTYRVEITLQPVKYYAGIVINSELEADFDNNWKIDLHDFARLADSWMGVLCYDQNNWCNEADMDKNFAVDLADMIILSREWMTDLNP